MIREIHDLKCCGIKEAWGISEQFKGSLTENMITEALNKTKSGVVGAGMRRSGLLLFTTSNGQKKAEDALEAHSGVRKICTFTNPNTGRNVTVWLGVPKDVEVTWHKKARKEEGEKVEKKVKRVSRTAVHGFSW